MSEIREGWVSMRGDVVVFTVTSEATQGAMVECAGDQTIEIDKLYGPLIACGVRVRLEVKTGEWVVSRERVPKDGETTWEEMARFDCQESIDFT